MNNLMQVVPDWDHMVIAEWVPFQSKVAAYDAGAGHAAAEIIGRVLDVVDNELRNTDSTLMRHVLDRLHRNISGMMWQPDHARMPAQPLFVHPLFPIDHP